MMAYMHVKHKRIVQRAVKSKVFCSVQIILSNNQVYSYGMCMVCVVFDAS